MMKMFEAPKCDCLKRNYDIQIVLNEAEEENLVQAIIWASS